MGGLFTPDGYGIYVSTKHALEAIAEAMSSELKKYNIKIQTIRERGGRRRTFRAFL
jgi:short-subunit dehydrogenase